MFKQRLVVLALFVSALVSYASAQTDEKANAIVAKAIQSVGGDRYLRVTSQIGRGKFSTIRDNAVVSFQTFVDVIALPDKERTEFKTGGIKNIQTNSGHTGWYFHGDTLSITDQSADQLASFTRGLRTSLDYLLRGYWKGEGEITYVGRRPATLGKRNDVIRLNYKDGLSIEFEFLTTERLQSLFTNIRRGTATKFLKRTITLNSSTSTVSRRRSLSTAIRTEHRLRESITTPLSSIKLSRTPSLQNPLIQKSSKKTSRFEHIELRRSILTDTLH